MNWNCEAKIQSNVLTWAPDFRSDPAELSVSGAKQARLDGGATGWRLGLFVADRNRPTLGVKQFSLALPTLLQNVMLHVWNIYIIVS
jgi:hypothetical protein